VVEVVCRKKETGGLVVWKLPTFSITPTTLPPYHMVKRKAVGVYIENVSDRVLGGGVVWGLLT
jgi:hypothetical protein